MNKVNRPTILPTALSSAIFLWSGVLALYFLAALLAYLAWCRLSDAGFPDQTGIVLRSSGKDLNDSGNFLFSAGNRIQFVL